MENNCLVLHGRENRVVVVGVCVWVFFVLFVFVCRVLPSHRTHLVEQEVEVLQRLREKKARHLLVQASVLDVQHAGIPALGLAKRLFFFRVVALLLFPPPYAHP